MKKYLKKTYIIFKLVLGVTLIIPVIYLFLAIPLLSLLNVNIETYDFINNNYQSLNIILTFFLVFATFTIAFVARKQLKKLNKTSRADFLLRIDNRYGDWPVIRARIIIQQLRNYVRSKHNMTNRCGDKNISEEEEVIEIGKEIEKMRKNFNQADEFICLLNLLDFLETIAYYANRDLIKVKEVDELMGGAVVYYFSIFEKLIKELRKEKNKEIYIQLEKLVHRSKGRSIKRTIKHENL